jgi:hypothetical protein
LELFSKFIPSPLLSKKNLLKRFKVAQLSNLYIIHNTRFWTENTIVRLFLVNTGFWGNILTALNYCIITLQTLYPFSKARMFKNSCQLLILVCNNLWDTIPHTFQQSNKWIRQNTFKILPLSKFLNIWKVCPWFSHSHFARLDAN